MLESLKALLPNINDHVKRITIILVAAFILCTVYPRHTEKKLSWGFPFVYRFEVRPEYVFPGEEDMRRGFNLLILFWDVWLTTFGAILIWYIGGAVWGKTRRNIDNISS